MADADRERFCDPRGNDPYDKMKGKYGWGQHRASSERLLAAPAARLERRGHRKSDELDLRYRLLSKYRRVNGLRFTVSHDYALDGHVEERNNRPRRDSQQLPSHEGFPISSRLHGRIKLPVNGSDLRQEREVDRGRSRLSRGRLSPRTRRAYVPSHQGKLRDRIHAEKKEKSYLGKRKNVMDNYQQSEGDASFEGPKPLRILKRKREAEAAASGSGKSSVYKQGNNSQRESRVSNPGDSETADAEMKSRLPIVAKEEPKNATADAVGTEDEKIDVAHGQSSEGHNGGELETEEGEIADGEEEEYQDDKDWVDFAKKIGVVLS